jgi:hypothetical protein
MGSVQCLLLLYSLKASLYPDIERYYSGMFIEEICLLLQKIVLDGRAHPSLTKVMPWRVEKEEYDSYLAEYA